MVRDTETREMITIKKAIDDLKHTAQFAAGAIRKVNNGTDSKAGQAEEAARRLSAATDLVTKTVGDHILHTNLDAEAALCVWEFMLEVKALSKAPEWAQSMLDLWDSMGTVHMRHIALDLGRSVNAVWQSMTEEERESVVPYDWEFCPAFVANLKFDRALANVDPIDIASMKAAILKDREVDAPEPASVLDTLKMAEEFMSGFEGDEMQDGVDARLATIRATIAQLEKGE